MNTRDKGKLIGAIGALLVHLLLIGFLVWMTILIPEPEEESGVPILMGEVDYAIGGEKVAHYVDVEVLPQEPKIEPIPAPDLPAEAQEEIITQVEEETVVIEPKKEPKKKPQKEPKKEPKKTKEKTPQEQALIAKKTEQERIERERKEAAEAKQREIERKERERKEAEAAARQRVAGAFGKGAQMDGENLSTQKVKDAFDGEVIETVEVDSAPSKYDMAFVVSGDSMEPMFEDGEVVFVNETQDVCNGQIAAIEINNEAFIKKIYLEDKRMRLVSLNTDIKADGSRLYPDFYADECDNLFVIGRVIM